MDVSVGTFNDPERFRLRTYQGRLVHGKTEADQGTIAGRIATMDLDVLCAQEVEDIDTLRFFAAPTTRASRCSAATCWRSTTCAAGARPRRSSGSWPPAPGPTAATWSWATSTTGRAARPSPSV